jgi:hypothetical protein
MAQENEKSVRLCPNNKTGTRTVSVGLLMQLEPKELVAANQVGEQGRQKEAFGIIRLTRLRANPLMEIGQKCLFGVPDERIIKSLNLLLICKLQLIPPPPLMLLLIVFSRHPTNAQLAVRTVQ